MEQDFPLSNGGDLHLTTAFWYTPSGHSIQKASPSDTNYGVTPNASVTLADPNSFYDISDPTSSPRGDSQLVAALQHLR